jgi:hypothetical protein
MTSVDYKVVVDPEWAKTEKLSKPLWLEDSPLESLSFEGALHKHAAIGRAPALLERFWTGHGRWDLWEGGLVVRHWVNTDQDLIPLGACIYRLNG